MSVLKGITSFLLNSNLADCFAQCRSANRKMFWILLNN